jgi:hypothetical protein
LPLCDILNRVSKPFGRVLGYVVDVGAVLCSFFGIDGRNRVLSRKMARSTIFFDRCTIYGRREDYDVLR